MNLYFRLLYALWRSVKRTRLTHVLDEASISLRVYPNDLDTNLHMNNGRYLTLMDLGRLDLLAAMGLWWPGLKRRYIAVLGASQMVHLKELRVFERFELKSSLESWDERWFVIVQRFFVGDTLHAIGRVRGQVRGPKGLVSPKTFLALSGYGDVQSPPPSEATRLWLESLRANRRTMQKTKEATDGAA